MRHILVVTAVEAEADAVRAGLRHAMDQVPVSRTRSGQSTIGGTPASQAQSGSLATGQAASDSRPDLARVVAGGVGPAAAAATTARLLALAEAAGQPYGGVISAGVAGGLPGRAPVGATVLATRSVAADLGADSPDGFLSVDELGFGTTGIEVDKSFLTGLRSSLPRAIVGDVLTVTTVTGTAHRARTLATRHPAAVAEAMEGYGVGCAAALSDVPFAELRTISNPVGPRDRAAWRLGDALIALTAAAAATFAGVGAGQ